MYLEMTVRTSLLEQTKTMLAGSPPLLLLLLLCGASASVAGKGGAETYASRPTIDVAGPQASRPLDADHEQGLEAVSSVTVEFDEHADLDERAEPIDTELPNESHEHASAEVLEEVARSEEAATTTTDVGSLPEDFEDRDDGTDILNEGGFMPPVSPAADMDAATADLEEGDADSSPGEYQAQEEEFDGVGGSDEEVVGLMTRTKVKAGEAWGNVKMGMERARHVRREVKTVFSSELEGCLLKATRPNNMAVDEACMQALLSQANRLGALEARYDCDPHDVVCHKLMKKMMEQDWRTVAKALYVLHRLQRDSPPKDSARFSAFFKEKWGEGIGELAKHMRADGGMHAPWLKLYCAYLAKRGRRLETATTAFRSWETLTSTRQLRNALTDTNTLIARALALHFAGDASFGSTAVGNDDGGAIIRSTCCALAFQDVADVQSVVSHTGHPPALLGIPGVEDEIVEHPSGSPEAGPSEGTPREQDSMEQGGERLASIDSDREIEGDESDETDVERLASSSAVYAADAATTVRGGASILERGEGAESDDVITTGTSPLEQPITQTSEDESDGDAPVDSGVDSADDGYHTAECEPPSPPSSSSLPDAEATLDGGSDNRGVGGDEGEATAAFGEVVEAATAEAASFKGLSAEDSLGEKDGKIAALDGDADVGNADSRAMGLKPSAAPVYDDVAAEHGQDDGVSEGQRRKGTSRSSDESLTSSSSRSSSSSLTPTTSKVASVAAAMERKDFFKIMVSVVKKENDRSAAATASALESMRMLENGEGDKSVPGDDDNYNQPSLVDSTLEDPAPEDPALEVSAVESTAVESTAVEDEGLEDTALEGKYVEDEAAPLSAEEPEQGVHEMESTVSDEAHAIADAASVDEERAVAAAMSGNEESAAAETMEGSGVSEIEEAVGDDAKPAVVDTPVVDEESTVPDETDETAAVAEEPVALPVDEESTVPDETDETVAVAEEPAATEVHVAVDEGPAIVAVKAVEEDSAIAVTVTIAVDRDLSAPAATDKDPAAAETSAADEESAAIDGIPAEHEAEPDAEGAVAEPSVPDEEPATREVSALEEEAVIGDEIAGDAEPELTKTVAVDEEPEIAPTMAVDELPEVAELVAMDEEQPATAETPLVEEEEPVIDETSVMGEELGVTETAAVDEELVVDETDTLDDEPDVEETETVYKEPGNAEAVDEEAVVTETPAEDDDPAVAAMAILEEEPAVAETATVDKEPAVVVETVVVDEVPEMVDASAVMDEEPGVDDTHTLDEETEVADAPDEDEEPAVAEAVTLDEEPEDAEAVTLDEEPEDAEAVTLDEEPEDTEAVTLDEELETRAEDEDESAIAEMPSALESGPAVVEEASNVEEPAIADTFAMEEEPPSLEETVVAVDAERAVDVPAVVSEDPLPDATGGIEEEEPEVDEIAVDERSESDVRGAVEDEAAVADPAEVTVTAADTDTADKAEAAAATMRDAPEDVLEAAKECAAYEDVSGVITAVYSARYGTDAEGNAREIPTWVRQMAALARLSGEHPPGNPGAAAPSRGEGAGGSTVDSAEEKTLVSDSNSEDGGDPEGTIPRPGLDSRGGGRGNSGVPRPDGDDRSRRVRGSSVGGFFVTKRSKAWS